MPDGTSPSLFPDSSPWFSVQVAAITTPPMARITMAASKGATGPKSMSRTRKLARRPERMATRPLPRNTA